MSDIMHDFTITLYALEGEDVSVRADVFVKKLEKTLKALKIADKNANNGNKTAMLVIDDLKHSSASVSLRERVVKSASIRSSGAALLCEALLHISTSPTNIPPPYIPFLSYAQSLTVGIDKNFSYAVISGKSGKKIRVDNFFGSQVKLAQKKNMSQSMYFSGTEDATFDGEIKVIDDRGDIPRGKIILTAGGQEIDCIFEKEMIDNIYFSHRVSVNGQAYYSSDSLLPQRVSVRSITKIDTDADLTRWRSAFKFDDSEDSWGDS